MGVKNRWGTFCEYMVIMEDSHSLIPMSGVGDVA